MDDKIRVTNDGGIYEIKVSRLSEVRGPAQQAQALYVEGEASKLARLQLKEERKTMDAIEKLPAARPDKRDRRKLTHLRGRA